MAQQESLVATRSRRANAGSRLKSLLQAEEILNYNDDDENVDLLFQENGSDDEFDIDEIEEDDDNQEEDEEGNDDDDNDNDNDDNNDNNERKRLLSSVTDNEQEYNSDEMFSDSDESSSGEEDEETGEKELQKHEKQKKREQAKKLKNERFKIKLNKKPKKKPQIEMINAESLLSETRRSSTRTSAVQNKIELVNKLKENEKRKALTKPKPQKETHILTQEEKLLEAIETEKRNILELTKFQEQEIVKKQKRSQMMSNKKRLHNIVRFITETKFLTIDEEIAENNKLKESLKKKEKRGRRTDRYKKKHESLMEKSLQEEKEFKKFKERGKLIEFGLTMKEIEIIEKKREEAKIREEKEKKIKEEEEEKEKKIKEEEVEKEKKIKEEEENKQELNGNSKVEESEANKEISDEANKNVGHEILKESEPTVIEEAKSTEEEKDEIKIDDAVEENLDDNKKEQPIEPKEEASIKQEIKESSLEKIEEESESKLSPNGDTENKEINLSNKALETQPETIKEELVEKIEEESIPLEIDELYYNIPPLKERPYQGPSSKIFRNYIIFENFDKPKILEDKQQIKSMTLGEQATWSGNRRSVNVERIVHIKPNKDSENLDVNNYKSDLFIPYNELKSEEFEQLSKLPKLGITENLNNQDDEFDKNEEITKEIVINTPAPSSIYLPNGQKKTCFITGKPALYFEPRTGIPYSSVDAYKVIDRIKQGDFAWCHLKGGSAGYVFARHGEPRHANGVPPGF